MEIHTSRRLANAFLLAVDAGRSTELFVTASAALLLPVTTVGGAAV